MSDRSWSNYPVGKTEPPCPPEMPGAVRGSDPELGPYWVRRVVQLFRWYDRGMTERVTRESSGR